MMTVDKLVQAARDALANEEPDGDDLIRDVETLANGIVKLLTVEVGMFHREGKRRMPTYDLVDVDVRNRMVYTSHLAAATPDEAREFAAAVLRAADEADHR